MKNKWYLTVLPKPDVALRGSQASDAILVDGPADAEYVVPRWLAEACRFELDHEHDDDLAEADA